MCSEERKIENVSEQKWATYNFLQNWNITVMTCILLIIIRIKSRKSSAVPPPAVACKVNYLTSQLLVFFLDFLSNTSFIRDSNSSSLVSMVVSLWVRCCSFFCRVCLGSEPPRTALQQRCCFAASASCWPHPVWDWGSPRSCQQKSAC